MSTTKLEKLTRLINEICDVLDRIKCLIKDSKTVFSELSVSEKKDHVGNIAKLYAIEDEREQIAIQIKAIEKQIAENPTSSSRDKIEDDWIKKLQHNQELTNKLLVRAEELYASLNRTSEDISSEESTIKPKPGCWTILEIVIPVFVFIWWLRHDFSTASFQNGQPVREEHRLFGSWYVGLFASIMTGFAINFLRKSLVKIFDKTK